MAYSNLGQTRRALEYHAQALSIAREIADRSQEARAIGNLANVYAVLGEIARALEYLEQALAIASEIGDRYNISICLATTAEVLIVESRLDEAMHRALESVNIGVEINSPTLASHGIGALALARLYMGDLAGARAAAEAARGHDDPQNNPNILALLGVIALRQGDLAAACEACGAAVVQADTLVAYDAQNYQALDAKGLALCGMVLSDSQKHIPAAIEAYRAARAICRGAGVVGRILRLLDALAEADSAGVLGAVRAVVGGASA